MKNLTESEKRTIRFAAIAITIYLAFFFGVRGWNYLEKSRSDYQRLVKEARDLTEHLQPYENKVLLLAKLKENLPIDLSKHSKASLVGEVSAAIQNAAQSGNVQLGPIRESPGRPAADELAVMQWEGVGPVLPIMQLLYRIEKLGYPLIIDSIQITPETGKPGQLKLTFHVIILDYEQWKKKEEGRRDV
jgi:hypothetical protein